MPTAIQKPPWLKVRLPHGEGYQTVNRLVKTNQLHTVCASARCPNIGECWERKTATFMILGDVCTRSCGFCAVKTGKPKSLDFSEPQRVATAVKTLNLRHAVITSVNRDELPDGGSSIFAETIRQIRQIHPCSIEVLIPDFQGVRLAWDTLFLAHPDILNHNMETIPRLYKRVRPQAQYQRSLELLKSAKEEGLVTKTGLMVGLGETPEEVIEVMEDLRAIECSILTIGQYLQPTQNHLPVERFVEPSEFVFYKRVGLQMGFRHVESGPLVRSSYHAEEQATERYGTLPEHFL